jgi:proline dehydrogenase
MPLAPRFLVAKVAMRYVAGERLEDAVSVVRELNETGAMATLDVLGEAVQDRPAASAAVEEYLRLYEAIAEHGLDSNVSVKPTLLGLSIDEAFCRDNIERIALAAREQENFLRIDMEDRTTTDATLRIYGELQARHGNLGVVLQAYMRRTLADIDEISSDGGNVRLCKGIYIEPRPVAWKGHETVRQNFVAALEKLFRRDIYVGIATHDEYLVGAAMALIDKLGLEPSQYEFQMLLGVDRELRRIILDGGHHLRVYVPYGPDWYPYSIRRLRENPDIAVHVARAVLSGK